jgi:coiled-coil domain-containing protein 63/114
LYIDTYVYSIRFRRYEEHQLDQEHQRKNILDGLESRYQSTLDATKACEEENKKNRESVHQIAKKVQSLFFKLQCDQMDSAKGPSSTAKGSKGGNSMARNEGKMAILTGQGVTESNVLDYMGAVEQRAVDIIGEHIKIHGSYGGGPRSPTPGPASPMQWPATTNIDLPDFDDDELFVDGEEVDSKPIDLGTFKDKLNKKMTFGAHALKTI